MVGMIGGALSQYQEEYERKMMIEQHQMMLREQSMLQQRSEMSVKPTHDPKAQDKRLLLLEE